MRRLHISLIIAFLLSSISLLAQVPQSINYQAMAFNGTTVYANQTFDVRFTLHLNNTTIYEEVHPSTTSNSQGLFVLKIGEGVPSSGTFTGIDWSGGPYSLRTELNPGSGYVLISDHSFSSVPYALFAERSILPVASAFNFNGDTLQIAQNGATLGQVLKWNGQEWMPDFDASNTYAAGTGINVSGSVITNTGDTDPTDDILTTSIAGGDVSGVFSNLNVVGIQGLSVSNTPPSNNEVLKWDGTQWTPAPDAVAAGGSVAVNARLSGDGSIGSPLDIAQNGANAGEVLTWDGTSSSWIPATVSGTTINAGPGINIVGGTIINTGDIDASDDITTSTNAGGDLSGLYPNPTVNGINGFAFANQTPNSGDVYKWNGTQWIPAADAVNDADADPTNEIQNMSLIGNVLSLSGGGNSVSLPTFTAGTGIGISGGTIFNTGDTDASDDITTATSAAGDVSGTFPTLTVDGLQGNAVASTAPSTGEVLKWNGSQWAPATDGNTSYIAGQGINITGSVISNTGDLNPNDDILIGSAAGGDLGGVYPNPVVTRINGFSVANSTPLLGQVYKWNGSQWVPAADETGPWTETTGNAIHDGDMFLQNGSGQTRVAAGITPTDRGYINVYDEFNNLKAGIQINASGQGEVFGDSKTFRMEHPEDPNKEIWYANLEGPEAGAYVRGTAQLINGTASINFPEHFHLIATADNMTIMLTPLSGDSEGLAVIQKTSNGFVVKELRNGTGNYQFDWEAKCIRQGFENFEVIRDRK